MTGLTATIKVPLPKAASHHIAKMEHFFFEEGHSHQTLLDCFWYRLHSATVENLYGGHTEQEWYKILKLHNFSLKRGSLLDIMRQYRKDDMGELEGMLQFS